MGDTAESADLYHESWLWFGSFATLYIWFINPWVQTRGFHSPHSPMRKDAKEAGFKDPDEKVNKAKKLNLVLKI